jgi:hypothetical protein
MKRLSHFQFTLLLAALVSFCLLSCRKEKECPSAQQPVDGRDKFVGQYKVYDTTGVYLYSMEIMKTSGSSGIDSVYVVNWGDRFNLYVQHDDGNATPFLNLAPPFPSLDHAGRRWAFFAESDPVFQTNKLVNDTLRMSYVINNIAFYAEDGVPFFAWSYREYGVKQ